MNESISRYWDKTKQYWNQFSKKQKIMFVSVFALTILALGMLVYYFSRTQYEWAYYDLDATDMAAVTEYLDSSGIPYKYGADGSSIAVPSSDVTDVKVNVAAQNLVQSGKQGFGLFRDNISGFGMTDKEFDLLSVDGRAGEIEKLLNSYQGVQKSLVLLSMPEESVFARAGQEETASASVSIQFAAGYRPDQQVIDSMYNLVRSGVGVDKLPISNITITDQSGNQLFASETTEGGMGQAALSIAEQHMRIKKEYEQDIKNDVERFLKTILGQDKVVVNVASSFNFDQRNREELLFEPVNEEEMQGIERSVQEITKSYTSEGGGDTGGVVGTGETDVPGYQNSASSGTSTSEEVNRTINYEINEIRQSIVSSPYVVQDLSIFVALESTEDKVVTPEVQQQVKTMLASLVGTSLANSDKQYTQEQLESKVSVIAQTFEGKEATTIPSGESNMMWYGIGAAALALIAIGGYFIFRRNKQEVVEEELPDENVPVEYPSIDLDSMTNDQQVRKQLENLAKKKPDEFVNLLRTWLVDE
ncbi:flagellar basal-body MS-ring/collar protein FliF [Marinicrinis lubricantis]|uniref:Flagellar M-ring protein n=1 Tax=Marinicrinis lubricantis TaxID=2086470 RepID=A0ABW1IML1_9BACL